MGLICMMVGHARNHRKVRRSGTAFVSMCKRCRVPMTRPSVDAKWRVYDPRVERFGDDSRAGGMVSLWDLPKV